MPRHKTETLTWYKWHDPDKIKVITYKRRKPKPTLKQFALRKNFGLVAHKNKGLVGTTVHNGYLMPSISKEMKEIIGTKSEDLITPDIIKEYDKKYVKKKKELIK